MARMTDQQRSEVLAKLAGGWTQQRTCTWLKRTHGVSITQSALSHMVKAARTERADTSKAVVRDHLGKQLPADLEVLDKRMTELNKLVTLLFAEAKKYPEESEVYLRALEQYRKLLETKLHYSGAGMPDDATGGIVDFLGKAFGSEAP